MTENDIGPLPHWVLETIYPSLESPEFLQAFQSVGEQSDAIDKLLNARNIRRGGWVPESARQAGEAVEAYLTASNRMMLEYTTLQAYIYGFVSTDSFDTLAKRRSSELDLVGVRIQTQEMRFKAWLGSLAEAGIDPAALAAHSPSAAEHVFSLEETVTQSRYLMSEDEETLAAELSLSGGSAWEKLQGTVTSQVTVPFERDGRVQDLPMSMLQNIMHYDPDESVRRRAFEAEIQAWERVREPLAACLNGIKGEVNTVDRRRGREDSLHRALDQARIDRETLEAMHSVMRQSFPMFRRYFQRKAQRLGKERWPGGTCSPHSERTAGVTRSIRRASSSGLSSRPSVRGWPAWLGAPSTSAGSTPNRATARSAAPSAWKCRGWSSRECWPTSTDRSINCSLWRMNSAMRFTTSARSG
jgi:oligoendopeptidase F